MPCGQLDRRVQSEVELNFLARHGPLTTGCLAGLGMDPVHHRVVCRERRRDDRRGERQAAVCAVAHAEIHIGGRVDPRRDLRSPKHRRARRSAHIGVGREHAIDLHLHLLNRGQACVSGSSPVKLAPVTLVASLTTKSSPVSICTRPEAGRDPIAIRPLGLPVEKKNGAAAAGAHKNTLETSTAAAVDFATRNPP